MDVRDGVPVPEGVRLPLREPVCVRLCVPVGVRVWVAVPVVLAVTVPLADPLWLREPDCEAESDCVPDGLGLCVCEPESD